jgi:hypothetical protein
MQNEVDRLVREFSSRLESFIRARVSAEVALAVRAVGVGANRPTRGRKGSARSARTLAKTSGKRSPEELAEWCTRLLSYVAAHPGQRAEQIGVGMGVDTSEMVLPIRRLLAERKIKAVGRARGTTYVATR